MLVADDASPDGTGEIADRLAAADPHVQVLHRPGKQGLGAAYLAGFAWGLERGYDVLVEMDADGSHQPEQAAPAPAGPGGRRRRRPGLALGAGRPGRELAGAPQADLARRHDVRAARAGRRRPRHDGWVPRVPGVGAACARPGRRRLAGVLLPDRPRLAGRAARPAAGGGAHHVRRARARAEQDGRRDRARGADPGHRVGRAAPRRAACARCAVGRPTARPAARADPGRPRTPPETARAGRTARCDRLAGPGLEGEVARRPTGVARGGQALRR
nr:glycosyltransferase [Angustibacter aerolatus]